MTHNKYGMSRFDMELRDIGAGNEAWTRIQVSYERDKVYLILDELGKEHDLESLTLFDRSRLEKRLILELSSNQSDADFDGETIMDLANRMKGYCDEIKDRK